MIGEYKVGALITARGGSKRIPKKNVKALGGKPLIAHTIEQARSSRYIDTVYVSTEDSEISKVSEAFGAIVIKRPKELATDKAKSVDVVRHAYSVIQPKPDLLVLLQPTSPMREASTIDAAIERFAERYNDFDSLVAVKKLSSSKGEILENCFVPDAKEGVPVQGIHEEFCPCGLLYIFKGRLMEDRSIENKSIYGDRVMPFIIKSEIESLDIDTPEEFQIAEGLMLLKEKVVGNKKQVIISGRKIAYGAPVFIIAEAGVNHNGDPILAKRLVDVAKEAGADAIKFQTFKAESLVTGKAEKAAYQKANTGGGESQSKMLKRLELSKEAFLELKAYCDKKGILFLSSPHTEDSLDFLDRLVPAYKMGSGDLTNTPFLEKVSKKGKPIILGTGMATLDEVRDALAAIKRAGNDQVITLHCTTSYPCPLSDVNMRAMITMMRELDCHIGYSDHTLGDIVPIMACALGARVIEKHITLDNSMPGPDHKASMAPAEFKSMVKRIRECERALGKEIKAPVTSEKETMKVVRKSVIAKKDIRAGDTFSSDNLIIKRPGTGMPPKEINRILGRKAKTAIKKDELIVWSDVK